MSRLIPLSQVPASARAAERAARRAHSTRASALAKARYELVQAAGTHSRPHFDAPSVGWVLTRAAGQALADELTRMPGGTYHRSLEMRDSEGSP